MLIRAIVLSLALVVGLGVIIPLATETTEAGPHKHRKYRQYRSKYKKYSKAWWRSLHNHNRKKRARMARLRKSRLHLIRLQAKKADAASPSTPSSSVARSVVPQQRESLSLLPSGEPAPISWKRSSATAGELLFRVDNSSGAQIGSAAISVVGPAMGETAERGRTKFLGGVPTTSLRREVINRMIAENGWVVNDFQKEVGGRSVYVVVAQSQAGGGRVQSRLFYFTEADGRIYSVSTNSSADEAERLAAESEKVINSLQRKPRPTQQAAREE
jgi:hypothetical protein